MQEVDRDQRWSQWKLRVQRASFQFLGDASENPKEMCWWFSKLLSDLETLEKNKAKKTRQWNNDLPADIDPAPAMDLPLLWLNTSCDWVPFMVKLLHFLHQNVTHPSCLLIWLRILKRFFWVWGGRLTRWLRKTWGNPQMPQSYGKPIKFARVSKFSEGF